MKGMNHWVAGLALVGGGCLLGQPPTEDDLRNQVRAEDLLSRWLSDRPPDATPDMPYDQAYRVALSLAREGVFASDEELGQFTLGELEYESKVLRSDNLERYQEASRRPATRPTTAPSSMPLPAELRRIAGRGGKPPRLPAGSLRSPPPTPSAEETFMRQLQQAGQYVNGVEAAGGRSSGSALIAAILSGGGIPEHFGVPSTLAPLDARDPASRQLNHILPQTLALPSNAEGTMAFSADVPGNPESVLPKPEDVQRLAAALGVSADRARAILTGRASVNDDRPAPASDSDFTGTALRESDPRFNTFYYGPASRYNNWSIDTTDPFAFQAGGGVYLRSDTRVNADPSMRVNDTPDRRVNANADTRVNVQVDPRANP